MTLATLGLVLALGADGGRTAGRSAALPAARAALQRGEFDRALQQLDRATAEPHPAAELAEIQLLRGVCFGALRQLERAREAFAHVPESSKNYKDAQKKAR